MAAFLCKVMDVVGIHSITRQGTNISQVITINNPMDLATVATTTTTSTRLQHLAGNLHLLVSEALLAALHHHLLLVMDRIIPKSPLDISKVLHMVGKVAMAHRQAMTATMIGDEVESEVVIITTMDTEVVVMATGAVVIATGEAGVENMTGK